MSGITTHVLDTSRGRPAAGVGITLERQSSDGFRKISERATNSDGRVPDLMPEPLEAGLYRLTFETGKYYDGAGFYPEVRIMFEIKDPTQHYHVPLLLSPFGYSTYRGS
ncbi:MAG: hydroxyisourate hydrolase [Armatimonadetes bacterium]|nr:hydroxyisourate hydrolase [Armatimonadota bacterium]